MSEVPPPEPPPSLPDPPRVELVAAPPPEPDRDLVSRTLTLQSRLASATPLTNLVAFALVAVHLWLFREAFGAQERPFVSEDLLLSIPSDRIILRGVVDGPLVLAGEWWRILSAPFLHLNVIHLLIDALFVRSLCRPTERLLGRGALALGLFAGALGSAAWAALAGSVLFGAAGAACGAAGILVTGLRGEGPPPGFAREVRGRILGSLFLFVLVSLVINFAMGAAGVPIAFGNDVLLGGFGGGLLAGLVLAPPLVAPVRLPPFRRSLERAAFATALFAALIMGLTGGRGASGPSDGRSFPGAGADPRARLVPGLSGDLRRVDLPALGLSVSVPKGWIELRRNKDQAHYGPSRGAPFLQIQIIRRPEGAFMPDYGDADTVVGEMRRMLEKEGAQDLVAAPYERTRLGGLPTTRVDLRYRLNGMAFQQIMLLARGRSSVYFLSFLGADGSADVMAARLAGEVRFSEGE